MRCAKESIARATTCIPPFPYDHYTLVNDADSAALYAFIMTRQPVQARTHDNNLPFPLNMRFLIAGWKLLFFHQGPYEQDSRHDAEWNRGAYLANGIGHCGACHTPRNNLGAEIAAQHFGGGDADGWHAYAINADSKSLEAWNAEDLHMYLSKGWHDRHGDAHGPMAAVAANLSSVPDADLKAIATYVAAVMGKRALATREKARWTALRATTRVPPYMRRPARAATMELALCPSAASNSC